MLKSIIDGGKRMANTTTERTERWKKKAYHRYIISLRYDTDGHLIDFLENNKNKIGTTQIFREALEMYEKSNRE